jgi:hypothetical protein
MRLRLWWDKADYYCCGQSRVRRHRVDSSQISPPISSQIAVARVGRASGPGNSRLTAAGNRIVGNDFRRAALSNGNRFSDTTETTAPIPVWPTARLRRIQRHDRANQTVLFRRLFTFRRHERRDDSNISRLTRLYSSPFGREPFWNCHHLLPGANRGRCLSARQNSVRRDTVD